MAYVITQACEGVCDTACVQVCPVDCIHGPNDPKGSGKEVKGLASKEGLQLYINDAECIDCGVCEPECPVKAIFPEDEVPDNMKIYIAKNKKFFA